MSDDVNQPVGNSVLTADGIAELAIMHATGLPPTVQRNFFKAVGKIISGGAEWPANYFQGKARVAQAAADVEVARLRAKAADIESQQSARSLVDRESAKAAANRFADDALAFRAVEFHAAHIVREQSRREDILRIAAEEISKNPPAADSRTEIEDDTLEAILREGGQRSTEEFKGLFGRILAGEIKAPGAFSIATIRSLGGMTHDTAQLFQRACNICSSHTLGTTEIMPPRLVEYSLGKAGQNAFSDFQLGYDDLMRLVEVGLLRPELDEWRSFPNFLIGQSPFDCGGRKLLLSRKDNVSPAPNPGDEAFRWSGPAFTRSGAELRQIVDVTLSPAYLNVAAKWYAGLGFNLFDVVFDAGGAGRGTLVPAD